MKPILIYAMPRSKSTVALQAAKRPIQHNEPIEWFNLAKDYNPNLITINSHSRMLQVRADNARYTNWQSIKHKMNDPNSASKIFGNGMVNFYPAREWFDDVEKSNSHDVYVLARNPKEVLWSFVIAMRVGFSRDSETPSRDIHIADGDIYQADLLMDSFLRFYPKTGTLVTFETLPEENFDHRQITMKKQDSLNKIRFVKNKDYVHACIENILACYQKEWEDKTGTDIFSFGKPN